MGPSRFHVMFGFGEPFPSAIHQINIDTVAARVHTEKKIILKMKKEKKKKTEIICNSTFIGAEKL